MYKLSKPQKLIYDMSKAVDGTISLICGSLITKGSKDLSEIKKAVNEIYRLNDALRIRIIETKQGPRQTVTKYVEREIETLYFNDKEEFKKYADQYAAEYADMYGELCTIKVILLNDSYGILVKVHHIIGDAWTLSLIGSQFNSFLEGKIPETYSYIDYLKNEDIYVQSKRYLKDKNFFLQQIKNCDEVSFLSDKPLTSMISKRKTFTIDTESTNRILDYTKSQNATVFFVFMSILAIYISKIKMNNEKFYIGTAILNRSNVKEKNTMGMFVNTVPLLIELDNDKTFIENLQKIKKAVFSIFRHQRYNYGELLEDLRQEKNFSGKLYDVILSYQNAKIMGSLGEFESMWHHNGMQAESLQIHIEDRDCENILHIHYDYQIDKFTENEIMYMHKHIMNLLFDVMKNSEKKICELEILSSSEKKKLLNGFNETLAKYPRNKCVHQLFEEQVLKTPNKIAVIACDKTMTYRELDKQADQIAYSLNEMGIGVGDIAAFALPRKSYLIAVIFGILKAGAAYLPIDLDYPKNRIDYILDNSKAKIFITEETIEELLKNERVSYPEIEISSDNTCYCIYTSGTTGNPKGILIKHSNVVNFVQNNDKNSFQKTILNNCDYFIAANSISFDITLQEIQLPLLNGRTCILLSDRQIYGNESMINLIENRRCGFIITPTKLNIYMHDKKFCESMKNIAVIMCGAEVFQKKTLREIKKYTDAIVFNGYGPTETTCGVLYSEVSDENKITIGKPIANTQIYILDKYLHPLPIGAVGEICIAGDSVGMGYLNNLELTAERFVQNPFGNGKMYRTGDLGYWTTEGNIVFTGRNDFQIKIRGLRIELNEIESAIDSIDGITQSVVICCRDRKQKQLISAFYTGKKISVKKIRKMLEEKLPRYMIPNAFIYLEEIPLTSSGKVNRNMLADMDLSAGIMTTEYIEAQTEKQKVLVDGISKVLGIEQISILDNFFDLGGDSLRAIELMTNLEHEGFYVEIKTIFSCGTIEELAGKLDRVEENKNRKEDVKDSDGDILATPAQAGIFAVQEMQKESTAYNVTYQFVADTISLDRLQQAVTDLIHRHEILRTYFTSREGIIIQIIENDVEFKIEEIESGDISTFIRPFNLNKAPLLRVGCYENTIVVDIHHIIIDGSSMPILLRELNELYMGRKLYDVPTPYRRFVMQKKDNIKSERYWLSVFSDDKKELELNTDYVREKQHRFKGNVLYDSIELALHNRILESCRRLNITPYVFYISGFYILLSKYSGNEDITIGVPISEREGEFLNTIGMFVNTIALRNYPAGEKSVKDFIDEVKESSINAMNNRNYPYNELIKKLHLKATGRNPLFDVMFAYQNEVMTQVIFDDKEVELQPIPVKASKYDFTFNIMPMKFKVAIMVEYCTELYRKSTIQRFVEGYLSVLNQMLYVSTLLKDISVISDLEKKKIQANFNDTLAEYPRTKCVHQLFEEQVIRTPDKIAVIACDKTITYSELNKQADKIADSLIAKGIGVGDIVAFALPRKSYLIAVIFGILKTGAAYLPIDLDYPKNRIDYILDNSNAKIFITEENIGDLLNNEKMEYPEPAVSSESICYCIYTSGSTGNPKGVLIRHKNLVNFCSVSEKNSFQKEVVSQGRILLSTFKCCFDAFGVDYALFLLNGKTVVLAGDNDISNGEKLAYLARKHNVDVIHSTPSVIKSLCFNNLYLQMLKQIKVLIIAAERFYPELYSYLKGITSAEIFNGYGPTEATIGVTFGKMDSESIHIGSPIANTQIYIVDKYMKLVPIGVTGELCIAGDGVGAGYQNCSDITAEKFIDNPFGKGKLYKTGDLAYWRSDGKIVYVGRNDFQVKIHGLRIELGEIENVICSVEGVVQAVTVVCEDEDGKQVICAFYTENKPVSIEKIKLAVSDRLPFYMVPRVITLLPQIPLTSNGKIDYKRLPKVDLRRSAYTAEYLKPEGEIEGQLALMVEKVLNYSPIGRDDNFFELGGDSLRAIEFISKAHDKGLYFSLQNVFDYPTVRRLSESIIKNNQKKNSLDSVDFTKVNEILMRNEMDNISIPQKNEIGNILLTGATGYLGIHILAGYLENQNGIVYCLVRGRDKEESRNRLSKLLEFYFGDKYLELNRIKVICADLQKEYFGISKPDYEELLCNITMVVNTAASVKHYGSYQYFYEANVETVKRLIKFCLESGAKLVHTSTLSVSGNGFSDVFDGYVSKDEKHFYENNLYIGQPLDNVYARSKFEAEKLILESIEEGLRANILRIGNLTSRSSDGVFQKNHETNAFLGRVKGILELGLFPDYLMDIYIEFTPVDEAAAAIIMIMEHFNMKHTVFHINNNKVIYMDKLLQYLRRLNINLEVVSGTKFANALRDTIKQSGKEYIFEAFINDMSSKEQLRYDSNIYIENAFTVEYLRQLNFEWTDVDFEYLRKYVAYLREIGYLYV